MQLTAMQLATDPSPTVAFTEYPQSALAIANHISNAMRPHIILKDAS